MKGPVKIFWSINISSEVLHVNNLKKRNFRAPTFSTYDFSPLHTTLPHNLIKAKLVDSVERIFKSKGSLYISCNDRHAFFTSDAVRVYNSWRSQKGCEALTFLLDKFFFSY